MLTTLWARISSGPFSCGLLLVAVPAYVAVVSLYVPSLPVHVLDRACETVEAVKSAAAACVDCVHCECAAAIPAAMRAAPATSAGTA